MAVRVAANVEELKRNLQEGVVNQVEVVRASFQRMTAAYDPQVLIQRANTTAVAIQQVGGASVLSGEQLARANKDIEAGVAAYTRLGKEAPAALVNLVTSLKSVSTNTEDFGGRVTVSEVEMRKQLGTTHELSGAYRQFDNLLQAVGLSVGNKIKGLIDISNASGKTAVEMGLLATAGLAVGAAIGGWNIGRWIADLTGADEKVANLTARMMAWGDVIAQTAGAKQDVINRAIANGARETITYTEAIKFNIEHQQRLSDLYVTSGQRLADAHRFVRNLTEARREEILRAKDNGASEEQLQRIYGVSAEALKVLIHQKNLTVAAREKLKKAADEEAAAAAKVTAQYQKETEALKAQWDNLNKLAELKAKHLDQYDAARAKLQPMIDEINRLAKARRESIEWEKNYLAEQEKLAGANDAFIAQQGQVKTKTDDTTKSVADATKGYAGLASQITLTGDAVKEWINLQRYSAQANAILQGGSSLFTTQSQRERIAALPSFASGVQNFAGGLAKVHRDELIVNLPMGTDVIPAGRGVGVTNITIAPVINVSGGSADAADIRDVVTRAIENIFRSGAVPFPSPV